MKWSNADRSKRAWKALKNYPAATEDPHADHQQFLVDLLADLLHLARARKGYAKINKRAMDFEDALRIARGHFEEETRAKASA